MFVTERELQEFLEFNSVSIKDWGTGKAKTVRHLLTEITEGESEVRLDGGRIIRALRALALNVYYVNGDVKLLLREDKQVFSDGRERERNLDSSLGEKIKGDEDIESAISRALEEELGILSETTVKRGVTKEEKYSLSYPSLLTVYEFWHFDAYIAPAEYKPEGYVEVQEDKQTFFVWVEA